MVFSLETKTLIFIRLIIKTNEDNMDVNMGFINIIFDNYFIINFDIIQIILNFNPNLRELNIKNVKYYYFVFIIIVLDFKICA